MLLLGAIYTKPGFYYELVNSSNPNNIIRKSSVLPLIIDGKIYKITFYTRTQNKDGSIQTPSKIEARCSLKLLPQKLAVLAKSFNSPAKGIYETKLVHLGNYDQEYDNFLAYHHNDLLTTYDILEKAHTLFLQQLGVNMQEVLTASGLALRVYKGKYYKPEVAPIYCRLGFYGGHVDVYIPKGENIYHYDVNSLYPTCMLQIMPSGKPRHIEDASNVSLDDIFGMVYVTVYCPLNLNRPVLPFRMQGPGGTQRLVFPTGVFQGWYFSEELS